MKRCIVKRANMTKSGAEANTLPKCKYFNQLQFLQEKITNKETVSNFSFSDISVASSPASSNSLNSPPPAVHPLNSPPAAYLQEQSSSASPSYTEPPAKKRVVGKRNKTDPIDDELINVIKDMNSATKTLVNSSTEKNNDLEDNENMLFCRSLAPTLDRLTKRDAALAKMEIQKVLFNIEFKE